MSILLTEPYNRREETAGLAFFASALREHQYGHILAIFHEKRWQSLFGGNGLVNYANQLNTPFQKRINNKFLNAFEVLRGKIRYLEQIYHW